MPGFVKKPDNLILVDILARRYGQRPSTILGIADDPYLAYQIDLTVLHFGLEHEAEAKKSGRKSRGGKGNRLVGASGKLPDDPKAYRSWGPPRRRIAIPESGVWNPADVKKKSG